MGYSLGSEALQGGAAGEWVCWIWVWLVPDGETVSGQVEVNVSVSEGLAVVQEYELEWLWHFIAGTEDWSSAGSVQVGGVGASAQAVWEFEASGWAIGALQTVRGDEIGCMAIRGPRELYQDCQGIPVEPGAEALPDQPIPLEAGTWSFESQAVVNTNGSPVALGAGFASASLVRSLPLVSAS